jgi:hypothetical protein
MVIKASTAAVGVAARVAMRTLICREAVGLAPDAKCAAMLVDSPSLRRADWACDVELPYTIADQRIDLCDA